MGEIRGYGGEIRGEISQHLAAHTHTRPSWETFRSKHGGHERDAGTVAKGRRFSLPFFNLAFSLSPSFPPFPPSSFLSILRGGFREGERASAVVSFLPDKGSGKTSNSRQTTAAAGAVWREQSRKTQYKWNKFFKGSPSQRLRRPGDMALLSLSHTHIWVPHESEVIAFTRFSQCTLPSKQTPSQGGKSRLGGKHAEISPRIQRPKKHINVKPIFCSNTEGKTQKHGFLVVFLSNMNASLKLKIHVLMWNPQKSKNNDVSFEAPRPRLLPSAYNADVPLASS